MVRPSTSGESPLFGVSGLIVAVVIVSALFIARDVFVPIALAVLLSFVLAPLVRLLQRWYLPRALAVGCTVLVALTILTGLAGTLVTQVAQLANNLPRYQFTISQKITDLQGAAAGTMTMRRVADTLSALQRQIRDPRPGAGTITTDIAPESAEAALAPRAIPVEVREPEGGPLETLQAVITPLVYPLAMTGIIVIFVVFILMQREDLRNRLIRLAGAHDLQRTTAALDDAGYRLSRLYLTQFILNAAFGVVIGGGLAVIGVPSAALWGILAAVLRFVPYVGVIISAVFPMALAAAVDPGWSMVVWTFVLFAIVDVTVGQLIEPLVAGQSTGLSPVAIVVAATFWTWLWGPIGLVLATPLTVCLVVLGRHIERLKFFDIIFSDQPALTPSELFYQRMLAKDAIEAAEEAEKFLRRRSLSAYYDEVALKGLLLCQQDASRGAIDAVRLAHFKTTVDEFLDDLSDHDDLIPEPPATKTSAVRDDETADGEIAFPVLAPEDLRAEWREGIPVLCIGGQNSVDDAAGAMFAQLLIKHGVNARVETSDSLTSSGIFRLDTSGLLLVCLSYVSPSTPAHMRFAIRRLRRRLPNARIVVGAWGLESKDDPEGFAAAIKADGLVRSLREGLQLVLTEAQDPEAASRAASVVPERTENAPELDLGPVLATP